MIGVIDRIEKDTAIVLLESEEELSQISIDIHQIPSTAQYENAVLDITIEEDDISNINHNSTEEKHRKERIEYKRERINS